jgi:hypothetical protein
VDDRTKAPKRELAARQCGIDPRYSGQIPDTLGCQGRAWGLDHAIGGRFPWRQIDRPPWGIDRVDRCTQIDDDPQISNYETLDRSFLVSEKGSGANSGANELV